jgi:hypothetical protein
MIPRLNVIILLLACLNFSGILGITSPTVVSNISSQAANAEETITLETTTEDGNTFTAVFILTDKNAVIYSIQVSSKEATNKTLYLRVLGTSRTIRLDPGKNSWSIPTALLGADPKQIEVIERTW